MMSCKKEGTSRTKKWIESLNAFKGRVAADIARPKRRYRVQHEGAESSTGRLLLHDVGLQIMMGVRVMQLLKDTDHPVCSRVVSRLIRHLFGADIHPNVDIAPGVAIIHGNGVVLGGNASVAEGCLIFQNVTLGQGRDPESGKTGSPTLGKNVHVGPGCTLVGPIHVGSDSKLMAGSVLDTSIDARSLVKPGKIRITKRNRKKD